jgi:hypothetical protein
MAKDLVEAVLKQAGARSEEGWQILPDGHSLTLHVAKDGATLNVPRVEAVAFEEKLLKARTKGGEVYFVFLEDVFAVASVGNTPTTKKAGFV